MKSARGFDNQAIVRSLADQPGLYIVSSDGATPMKQERPAKSWWANRIYNRWDPRSFHISNDQLKGQGNKQWQLSLSPTDVSTDPVQHSAVRKLAYLEDYHAKWLIWWWQNYQLPWTTSVEWFPESWTQNNNTIWTCCQTLLSRILHHYGLWSFHHLYLMD